MLPVTAHTGYNGKDTGSRAERFGVKFSPETHLPCDLEAAPTRDSMSDFVRVLWTCSKLRLPLPCSLPTPSLRAGVCVWSFTSAAYSTTICPFCFPPRILQEVPRMLELKESFLEQPHFEKENYQPHIPKRAGSRPGSPAAYKSSHVPSLPFFLSRGP